jgi:hypothetical protein
MTVPDASYITVEDLKGQTKISALAGLGSEDLITLIQTAEDMIDAYVGRQKHHYYDTNITRVFPRVEDYHRTNFIEYPAIPEIPYQVSRACLRQVEWLYSQWWPNKDTEEIPVEYDVSDIDIGGDGSISEKRVRDGLDFSSATLSVQARSLLIPFRSRVAGIAVSNPRGTPHSVSLSSREGLPGIIQ